MHKYHLYIDINLPDLLYMGPSGCTPCAGNSNPKFFLATGTLLGVNAKKGMFNG